MFDPRYTIAECNVCRREYTSFHFEVLPGSKISVCQSCIDRSENDFIWICINCGRSYSRPKQVVMNRLNGYGLRFAALLYGSKIIQGLELCIECNPDGILHFARNRPQSGMIELRADLSMR